MPQPFHRAALVCALVALCCAGCGHTHARAASPTSTTPPSTSAPTPTIDSTILAQYGKWWPAYLAAGSAANPDDPQLAQLATGQELQTVQKSLFGLKVAGDVIEGTITESPTLVSSGATTATIRDCSVDRSHIYSQATGQQIGNAQDSTDLLLVTMTLDNGTWKVSTTDHQGTGCTPSQS